MTETTEIEVRRPKGRSPGYPAIGLEHAIRRARQLHDLARQHPTPVDSVVRHWGYKSLNGPASLTIAALKKFALLADEGSRTERRVRLTDLAMDVLGNPDPEKRQAAVRQAALSPAVHRELWERYGTDLPPDVNLQWELTRDRGFTETGARELIPVYRDTIAFARLAEMVGRDEEDRANDDSEEVDTDGVNNERSSGQDRDATMRRPGSPVRAGATFYVIPLVSGSSVTVEGEFPITERDWNQFLAVLTAMKPGLVATSEET